MNFFDSFLIMFGYFTIFSFVMVFIGSIMVVYSRVNRNENSIRLKKIGVILIVQLVFVFMLLFSLHIIFNKIVRNEIIEMLNSKDLIIKINNKEININDRMQIINDLKNYTFKTPDHSGPVGQIYKVELKTKIKSKKLYLQQNSMDTTIFYVWDYTYKTSTMNDVGSIRTVILKKY